MGKTRNTADLVSDNNISIDISNDRIGIGTINPQAKLHVVGDTRITGVVTATAFYGDGSNLSGVSGGGSSGIGTGVAIAMAIVFG